MNTEAENNYYKLHSDTTIEFQTVETKNINYEYQFTDEIKEQFEKWKLEVLELTDEEPTQMEMLEYFKKLDVISFSTYYGTREPDIEILNININL